VCARNKIVSQLRKKKKEKFGSSRHRTGKGGKGGDRGGPSGAENKREKRERRKKGAVTSFAKFKQKIREERRKRENLHTSTLFGRGKGEKGGGKLNITFYWEEGGGGKEVLRFFQWPR